jgi:ABC-type branched-subunit amino acid transport system substrate-binding protein
MPTALASSANAQKKYDPGATDTEIKIGNIMPYSGPSSLRARSQDRGGLLQEDQSEGGINGRKINFISYDDGYSPPKTVEQARKLVESDEVLRSSIARHARQHRDPEIHERKKGAADFSFSGAAKWTDPKNFPWTIGWQPNYQVEARIYAAYILKHYPARPSA